MSPHARHTRGTRELCTMKGCVPTLSRPLWPRIRQLPAQEAILALDIYGSPPRPSSWPRGSVWRKESWTEIQAGADKSWLCFRLTRYPQSLWAGTGKRECCGVPRRGAEPGATEVNLAQYKVKPPGIFLKKSLSTFYKPCSVQGLSPAPLFTAAWRGIAGLTRGHEQGPVRPVSILPLPPASVSWPPYMTPLGLGLLVCKMRQQPPLSRVVGRSSQYI